MTTPNVPYRFEVELVVPGTTTDVWQAIATAEGCSAWMMPTTGIAEVGGALVFDMGPDAISTARITAAEPERRLVYEEGWLAPEASGADANVTPLVTEFLIEARSGGTCVVKVVTSAFGVGADWEHEFFDQMSAGWGPMLDNLRVYMTLFPGQQSTPMGMFTTFPVGQADAIAAMRDAFGFAQAGDAFSARDATGSVERSEELGFVLHFEAPVPGYASFFAFPQPDGTGVGMQGHLFSADAAAYVEQEQAAWQAWLEDVATQTAVAR